MADQIVLHRCRTTRAKCQVIFPCALLVGMAFDDDGVIGIGGQPLRLTCKHAARFISQAGLVHRKQHAVANRLIEIGNRLWVGWIAQTIGVNEATVHAIGTRAIGTARTIAVGVVTGRKTKGHDQKQRFRNHRHMFVLLFMSSIGRVISALRGLGNRPRCAMLGKQRRPCRIRGGAIGFDRFQIAAGDVH